MIKPAHCFLFVFFLICSTSIYADRLRILVTNDDGIDSPLLQALVSGLKDTHEVLVSAPRENQSGSAHASSSSTPLKVEKIERKGSFYGYGVYGRPADAARFGILKLGKEKPIDVLISGINRGANVGKVSHLSGTVGAAMEGLYHGIPSISVSQDPRANTDISVQLTQQILQHYQLHGAPTGTLISINVPAGDIKEIVVLGVFGGGLRFGDFQIIEAENEDNATTYQGGWNIASTDENDNDTRAYQQGKATITPLKFDWTDHDMIQTIKKWELRVSP